MAYLVTHVYLLSHNHLFLGLSWAALHLFDLQCWCCLLLCVCLLVTFFNWNFILIRVWYIAEFVIIFVYDWSMCFFIFFLSTILLYPCVSWVSFGASVGCHTSIVHRCVFSIYTPVVSTLVFSTLSSFSGLFSTLVISTLFLSGLLISSWLLSSFIAVFFCEYYTLVCFACCWKLMYSGCYFSWQRQYHPIISDYSFPYV